MYDCIQPNTQRKTAKQERSLGRIQAQTVFWGPYFPLRTACLFSCGKRKYFSFYYCLVVNNKILSLNFYIVPLLPRINATLNNHPFPLSIFWPATIRCVTPTVTRPYAPLNHVVLSPCCAPTSNYNHDGRHQMIRVQLRSSFP